MYTILLFTFNLFSFTFSGTVYDQSTGQPLADASVQLVEMQRSTTTDAQGIFQFTDLPEGKYTLKISHMGYISTEIPLTAPQAQTRLEIRLQPRTLVSEEVIIRGVRADALTPISQKTLDRATLEQNYYGQEMPALLTQTPSINFYTDAGNPFGYSYMRLRGIDQTRINFTLNGLPLNEPEDQGLYFSNFADFGNSIQSVQVQRGVGTSTSGTASFAGSINFESTSLADSVSSAEVHLSQGSYNSYRFSPEYASGLQKNGFSFYGRYSLVHTDGYKYHSGTHAHSFFLSGGYFGQRDLVKVTAFVGNTKNALGYLPVLKADIDKDPRTNPLTEEEKDDFSQSLVQVQYTHTFSEKTSAMLSTYYSRLDGSYDVKLPDLQPDTYFLQNFALVSDFAGSMLNLNYDTTPLKLQVGIHANTYRRDHFAGIRPFVSNRLYFNSGYKNEFSTFGKIQYTLWRLTFFGDAQVRTVSFRYQPEVRYNLPEKRISWTFLSPKIGATYQITNILHTYFSIGSTRREPTRSDLFGGDDDMNTNNLSIIEDFTRIKPERVRDIEIGLQYTTRNLSAQLNIYDMQFRNEIAAIGQLSYIGLPLRKNVGKSFRRGVEWDSRWNIVPQLTFTQAASYMHARIASYTNDADNTTFTNVTPLLSPKWMFSGGLVYQTLANSSKKWGLAAELNSRYVSESFLANDNNVNFVTPSFLLLNSRVSVVFLNKHRLSLLINNLTDKQYFTSGQVSNGETAYFAQARRNYFLSLDLAF